MSAKGRIKMNVFSHKKIMLIDVLITSNLPHIRTQDFGGQAD